MSEPDDTRDAPPPGQSQLPALGRRGGGWVGLQVAIFALAGAAGLRGVPWPSSARFWLSIAAAAIVAAGAGMLLAGGAGLGRQLTPFPRPLPGGELRQDGIYRFARHPIYGGVVLLLLGWALLTSPLALAPWLLGAAFFDLKRRREELWLQAHYPEYEEYRQRVRWAFLPFLW